jgi:PAS domain S-box-containing protein
VTVLDFPLTEQRTAPNAVQEDLTERLPIGIFRTDRRDRLIFVNRFWSEITGASAAQTMKSGWMQLVHPLDRELVAECWSSAVSGEEEFDLEFRFLSSTGRRTWVRGCAHAEYDEDDIFTGYVGSLSDITQLKESQQQLLTILNNLTDVVVLIGENGRILRINPAAESLFGYKPHELIGEHCAVLVIPAERDRLLSCFLTSVRNPAGTEEYDVLRFRGATRSGGLVEIEVSFDESQLAGKRSFIGVMRDVSERTRRELYIRESQKMSALAQVTRGVSHEFSNLLSVMMGNLELLSLKLDPETRNQYIEPSLQAGERGGDLVQRLLAFNRQQPLSVAPTQIGDFMRDLEQSVNNDAMSGIRIELDCDRIDSAIRVDTGYLQICLQQILQNAEEACREDESTPDKVVVGIEVMETELDAAHQLQGHCADKIGADESGSYVRILIRDEGPGMDELVLGRCIDPFFSTRPDHAGLGLSSVVGFIRQSDGFVSIESDPGQGTSVYLYLPHCAS